MATVEASLLQHDDKKKALEARVLSLLQAIKERKSAALESAPTVVSEPLVLEDKSRAEETVVVELSDGEKIYQAAKLITEIRMHLNFREYVTGDILDNLDVKEKIEIMTFFESYDGKRDAMKEKALDWRAMPFLLRPCEDYPGCFVLAFPIIRFNDAHDKEWAYMQVLFGIEGEKIQVLRENEENNALERERDNTKIGKDGTAPLLQYDSFSDFVEMETSDSLLEKETYKYVVSIIQLKKQGGHKKYISMVLKKEASTKKMEVIGALLESLGPLNRDDSGLLQMSLEENRHIKSLIYIDLIERFLSEPLDLKKEVIQIQEKIKQYFHYLQAIEEFHKRIMEENASLEKEKKQLEDFCEEVRVSTDMQSTMADENDTDQFYISQERLRYVVAKFKLNESLLEQYHLGKQYFKRTLFWYITKSELFLFIKKLMTEFPNNYKEKLMGKLHKLQKIQAKLSKDVENPPVSMPEDPKTPTHPMSVNYLYNSMKLPDFSEFWQMNAHQSIVDRPAR